MASSTGQTQARSQSVLTVAGWPGIAVLVVIVLTLGGIATALLVGFDPSPDDHHKAITDKYDIQVDSWGQTVPDDRGSDVTSIWRIDGEYTTCTFRPEGTILVCTGAEVPLTTP